MKNIRTWQLHFFGHVKRHNRVMETNDGRGKAEGKRRKTKKEDDK